MFVLVPIEIFLIITACFKRKLSCDYLVCTDIFEWLPSVLKNANTGVISPYWIKSRNGERAFKCVPVGYIYCILGFLPWRYKLIRDLINRCLPRAVGLSVGLFVNQGATLILHSDSLPFARVLIKSLRHKNIRIVCLQHGSFHECISELYPETCGMYSDLNIVRSDVDKLIIGRKAIYSEMIVLPSLFYPSINIKRGSERKNNLVLLIGEGYHTIDEVVQAEIDFRYHEIWEELTAAGYVCNYRPHPSEKRDGVPNNYKVIDTLPLADSLGVVVAVIGYSSSVLIQSAALGIPTFQIKVGGNFFNGLIRNGQTIMPYYSLDQFKEQVNGYNFSSTIDLEQEKIDAVRRFESLLFSR